MVVDLFGLLMGCWASTSDAKIPAIQMALSLSPALKIFLDGDACRLSCVLELADNDIAQFRDTCDSFEVGSLSFFEALNCAVSFSDFADACGPMCRGFSLDTLLEKCIIPLRDVFIVLVETRLDFRVKILDGVDERVFRSKKPLVR